MSYKLIFTDQYLKRETRWLRKHQPLQGQYYKTLQLLEANPHHPSLRLHALQGKRHGLHSVSINISYRISIEFLIEDRKIIPINVGDHEVVYR